jgi:pilus assembly protein CpaF
MSRMIEPNERIITIEDAAELKLDQPHVVTLETRDASLEGDGKVSIRDLFVNALRMRPDRIIVGEVRGSEAFDMLQAMNTGHDGSLGTIHANSPRDALYRLENMVSMANPSMSIKGIRQQIASAVDVVVQVSRAKDGRRRIVAVEEAMGMEGEIITMQPLYNWDPTRQQFASTQYRPNCWAKIQAAGLDKLYMEKLGIDE